MNFSITLMGQGLTGRPTCRPWKKTEISLQSSFYAEARLTLLNGHNTKRRHFAATCTSAEDIRRFLRPAPETLQEFQRSGSAPAS